MSEKYLKQYATLGHSDTNQFQIEQKLEHGYRKIEQLEKVKQFEASPITEEDDLQFVEMSLSYYRKKL